jgi:hypothetical protein
MAGLAKLVTISATSAAEAQVNLDLFLLFLNEYAHLKAKYQITLCEIRSDSTENSFLRAVNTIRWRD